MSCTALAVHALALARGHSDATVSLCLSTSNSSPSATSSSSSTSSVADSRPSSAGIPHHGSREEELTRDYSYGQLSRPHFSLDHPGTGAVRVLAWRPKGVGGGSGSGGNSGGLNSASSASSSAASNPSPFSSAAASPAAVSSHTTPILASAAADCVVLWDMTAVVEASARQAPQGIGAGSGGAAMKTKKKDVADDSSERDNGDGDNDRGSSGAAGSLHTENITSRAMLATLSMPLVGGGSSAGVGRNATPEGSAGGFGLDSTALERASRVRDIAWSRFDENILAACSPAVAVVLWDIREPRRPVQYHQTLRGWAGGASRLRWNQGR
jgi:hypothetical protein